MADSSTGWHKWFLTRIEDRYGNWMSISYGPRGDTWVWTITDSHERSHRVVFAAGGRVDKVEVEAFGTTRRSNRFQINFRNHRKIVVVDGCRSFASFCSLFRAISFSYLRGNGKICFLTTAVDVVKTFQYIL